MQGFAPRTPAGTPEALAPAMTEAGIVGPFRAAAFLAQLAHESGEFRLLREGWGPSPAQLRYERPPGAALVTDPDRKKWPLWQRLGNLESGDGFRFRGRGYIQLTGRSNYQRAGAALELDLEGDPDLCCTVPVAAQVACWFWREHGLNELADGGAAKFDAITEVINGGQLGQLQRRRFFERLCKLLELPAPPWVKAA